MASEVALEVLLEVTLDLVALMKGTCFVQELVYFGANPSYSLCLRDT